jgi:hypothetical protein
MDKTELLVAWAEGRHALGWRGWVARRLLEPVLNAEIANNSNQRIATN